MYIDYYRFIEKEVLEIELLKAKRDKAELELKLLKDMLKQQTKTKKCCNTCEYYHKHGQFLICVNEKHMGDFVQNYTVCDEWKEK